MAVFTVCKQVQLGKKHQIKSGQGKVKNKPAVAHAVFFKLILSSHFHKQKSSEPLPSQQPVF